MAGLRVTATGPDASAVDPNVGHAAGGDVVGLLVEADPQPAATVATANAAIAAQTWSGRVATRSTDPQPLTRVIA